jgi:hypothetical protein
MALEPSEVYNTGLQRKVQQLEEQLRDKQLIIDLLQQKKG